MSEKLCLHVKYLSANSSDDFDLCVCVCVCYHNTHKELV